MAISTKPTILFVHGACHSPVRFGPVRSVFEKAGYPTTCPQQPSFRSKGTSMYDDAAVIRAELDRLINAEDCNVIVVLYSYGGTIGTQAVHASLGARTRREQGLSGGVQSILYIAAAISPEGKSVLDMFGHNQPPFLVDKGDGNIYFYDHANVFYNDLPEAEWQRWVEECAPTIPTAALKSPVTYLAYQHYPCTFLVCKNDNVILAAAQREAAMASGNEFRFESCDAGHLAYINQPETVLRVVEKMAAAAEQSDGL